MTLRKLLGKLGYCEYILSFGGNGYYTLGPSFVVEKDDEEESSIEQGVYARFTFEGESDEYFVLDQQVTISGHIISAKTIEGIDAEIAIFVPVNLRKYR